MPLSQKRFGGSQKKGCRELPRSSRLPRAGAGRHLPAAAVSTEGRRSPRKERPDAVTDSSSPQAGTSGQRRQHGCHLGQGTVCPPEPTWDGRVDGWLPSRDEEVVKSCGNNRVNNHLQREHGELGTRSHKPPKPSISRSCRWEGQPRPRDASSRPVPMPSCAGSASTWALREGEPGWELRWEARKLHQPPPGCGTEEAPGNEVVASAPWVGHLLGAPLGCKRAPRDSQQAEASKDSKVMTKVSYRQG